MRQEDMKQRKQQVDTKSRKQLPAKNVTEKQGTDSLSKVLDEEMMKFTSYQLRDLSKGMGMTQVGNKEELIEKIVSRARQCGVTVPQTKYLVSLYYEHYGRSGSLPVVAFESKAGATAFITSILTDMKGEKGDDGAQGGCRWVPRNSESSTGEGRAG
jgi:hypothetical protein